MPAGHRLRIRDLADQVGTSVMPVREAIRRLEEAGLAERQPHKGAVVKGLTLSELVHVYDVRRLMEVEAARLGARAISGLDVDRMKAEYDAMRAAIDNKAAIAVLDHDEAFLTILYQASGNPVLVNAIRALWEQCRSYKIVGAHATLNSEDRSPLWTYQSRLLAAARDNAADLAARINGESLGNATSRIHDQLAAESISGDKEPGGTRSPDETAVHPVPLA
jgi:DNA-binding GntR family transcriptional regulator